MSLNRKDLTLSLGAMVGIFLSNFAIFSAPLYIGSLIDGMGFSEFEAGLISAVEIGAVAVVCLLLSSSLGRYSPRMMAVAGVAVVIMANLLTLFLEGVLPILSARLIAGIGGGLGLAATSALLSRTSDPDQIVGLVVTINTVVMIVLLSVMGYVKERWMFDGIIGLFTLAALVLFPLLRLLPATSYSALVADQKDAGSVDHHVFLGITGMVLLFLFCIVEGGVWAFSERSAVNIGITEGSIGMLLGLAQGCGLFGAILAAVFGNRIPFIYPVGLGGFFMGTAGLVVYQTDSSLFYAIGLCFFSFGFFFSFPYLLGACARLSADGRWASRATGINLLGGAVAPFIAASVVGASDYSMLGVFCFTLALICISVAWVFYQMIIRKDLVDNLVSEAI